MCCQLYSYHSMPAIGFEWKKRAAADDQVRLRLHDIDFEAETSKYTEICSLGDHNFKCKHSAKIRNIFKILGYIPFVGGQVAGIFHIKKSIQLFQLNMDSSIKLSAVVLLIRGVSEICGVGFLFFFLDIAKLGADGVNELVQRNTPSGF